MNHILSCEDLVTSYNGVSINKDVNIELGNSEVVSLIGRNGVGKTTLAKTIVGIKYPDRGRITFRGADITKSPGHKRARMGLAYVPQGRGIFGNLSVKENLQTGRNIGSASNGLERAFDIFPMLRDRSRQLASTLSGGQQQMLAIGRVLTGEPTLLILDEPSDGIQPSIVQEIGEVITRLNTELKLTILLIEQNLELISSCSKRCIVMDQGTIIEEVPSQALNDASFAQKYLAV